MTPEKDFLVEAALTVAVAAGVVVAIVALYLLWRLVKAEEHENDKG